MPDKIRNFLLELFFPKECLSCQKEGDFLCPDCEGMVEVSPWHKKYQTKYLTDLYFPLSYQNNIIKNLIKKLKYAPFAKDISKTLARLVFNHFRLLDSQPDFSDFVLIPVPLEKRRLKWRGFNQSEEIGKELSVFLKIPQFFDTLKKIKPTLNQAGLSEVSREQNISRAFVCPSPEKIHGQNILLIDDVYTSGATMEECAKTLLEAGAQKVTGLVVARAELGKDMIPRA